jgi:hypothetical protein
VNATIPARAARAIIVAMRVKSPLFAAFATLGTFAVFILPLLIPAKPTGSISYILGFNNRVALLSYLAVLAIGSFTLKIPGLVQTTPQSGARTERKWVIGILTVTALLCAVMYWAAAFQQGFDEAPYLLTRLRQMSIGLHPYLDFEFLYGPIILYPALWIYRFVHLNIVDAYFAWWAIQWLLGIGVQVYIVRWLGFTQKNQKVAFVLLWLAFLPWIVTVGLSYTPLRQLGALFCVLATHRLIVGRGWVWRGSFFAVAASAVLFGFSPENAIAFIVGATVYFAALLMWHNRKALFAFPVMLAGFVLVYHLASHLHEMDSTKGFAAGGSNIPLLLTPQTFALLAAIFFSVCYAVVQWRSGNIAEIRVAAVTLSVCLIPGAFGRCDPGHLITYGIGALLVVLAIAETRPGIWKPTVAMFILFAVLPTAFAKVYSDRLSLWTAAIHAVFPQGQANSALAKKVEAEMLAHGKGVFLGKMLFRVTPGPYDPRDEYPQASAIVASTAQYGVHPLGSALSLQVAEGYFNGYTNVTGPLQFQRKIDELAAHPERDLLLPVGTVMSDGCPSNAQSANELMTSNFGYNYLHRTRHELHIAEPFCNYIAQNYERIAVPRDKYYGFELWRRKPQS